MKIQAPAALLIGLLVMSLTEEASGSLSATYLTEDDIPVSAATYTASGEVDFTLGYLPTTGTELMVVENTGLGFITGEFTNLAQGDSVLLVNGTQGYEFVANYYGGSGNDLVLVWKWTEAWAWGRNDDSELGDGTTVDSNAPVMVAGGTVLEGKTLITASALNRSSVTLSSDGTLAAWGRNFFGQLGDGTTTGRAFPVAVNQTGVLDEKTVISVATGLTHVMALCSDGTLAAWGSNGSGLLGDGTTTARSLPVTVDQSGVPGVPDVRSVVAVAAGGFHNVALYSDGTLAAWGYNGFGELGDGTNTDRHVPTFLDMTGGVLDGKTVVEVAAGWAHTVVRCSDGTLAAWGYNVGQLGDGTTTWTNIPVLVDQTGVLNGKTPVSLAAGTEHTVVLCSDGTLVAWGQDEFGQLGESLAEVDRSVPVLVDQSGVLAGKTVISISAGDFHNVAQCSDGTLAAWGDNEYLQIGLVGAVAERHVPVVVNQGATLDGKGKVSVSSGSSHNLVIAAEPMTILVAAVIDTTVDENDGSAIGGVSLRDAINEVASGGIITFDSSLSGQTITLTNGQLLIDRSLTIDASALTDPVTVDANRNVTNHRVLEIAGGHAVTIDSLHLTKGTGYGNGGGGGIFNGGTLTLSNSTISHNGGGIYNGGTLTLNNSTISDNGGRGISNGGTLTLNNSTLSGNGNVSNNGGGIYNFGTLTLNNSTLFDNCASSGGGIYGTFPSSLTLNNSTISGNAADDGGTGGGGVGGGGIFMDGSLSATNSIVAGNTSSLGEPNINIFGSITGTNNLTSGDPMLEPFGYYGGPTKTMPPRPGSPAIDPVAGASTSPFPSDQRGFARVFNGTVDIGAVEYGPALPLEVDTLVDENDGLLSGGISLRDAIAASWNNGIITIAPALSGATITLTNGQLVIDNNLTIDASALAGGLTIDADGANTNHRVLEVSPGFVVVIKGLTITGGRTADGAYGSTPTSGTDGGNGGGILNGGYLTLVGCTIAGNATGDGGNGRPGRAGSVDGIDGKSGGSGGGIYSTSRISLTNCTVAENTTGRGGNGGSGVTPPIGTRGDGGDGGDGGFGAGIYHGSGSLLTLIHSTITENTTGDRGTGGSGNTPGTSGSGGLGGGVRALGSLAIDNTLISENSVGIGGTGPDLARNSSSFSPSGVNFIGDLGGSGLTASPTLLTGDAMLATLGDYGGPTQTIALLPGSPAIDGGSGASPPTDQRGFSRVVGAAADIGAYEFGNIAGYGAWAIETIPANFDGTYLGDPDNDDSANGIEYALGTAALLSDPGAPGNPALRELPSGGIEITFGLNPDASIDTRWIVKRSIDLVNFTEIYNYHGPTATSTSAPGVSATVGATSFTVTDTNPPGPRAFYKIGVEKL